MREETLLNALLDRQRSLGASDGRFAAMLGVSRPLWCKTRRGLKPIGLAVLSGAYRAFPDLAPAVLFFLAD